MKIREDLWLSDAFGYSVFRVQADDVVPTPAELDRLGDIPTPAFCYAKVPTHHVDVVQALTGRGFYPVDVNITLRHVLGDDTDLPGAGERATVDADGTKVGEPAAQRYIVKVAEPEEAAAAQDIARRGFSTSRFHLDPRMSPGVADEIKARWVQSYAEGERGSELLVALLDGKTCGFLAVLERSSNGRRTRVIDLIATDPRTRGRGVGAALVQAFIRRSGSADAVEVGTQAANVGSLRFYQRLGFTVSATSYVLHWHHGGGR